MATRLIEADIQEVKNQAGGNAKYTLSVDGKQITAHVTGSAATVNQWVTKTEQRNHRRLNRLVVAMDLYRREGPLSAHETSVAALVVAIDNRCLVFRIPRVGGIIPPSLKAFLENPTYLHVGMKMDYIKQILNSEHAVMPLKTLDLVELGKFELEWPQLSTFANKWQTLMMYMTGSHADYTEVETLQESDWDTAVLTANQVVYSTIIATGSQQIASRLLSGYRR